MPVPSSKSFRILCAILGFLCIATAHAQYTVNRPSYDSRETPSISVEAIRYYPDHIWIDLNYQDNINNEPGYRINKTTAIVFPWLDDTDVMMDNVSNVGYTDYKYVKKGSKNVFSLRFPFNIANIFSDDQDYNRATVSDMARSFPLKMDLVECRESYKKQAENGGCFNIYGINLGLSFDQLTVLYCEKVLQESLRKDEFETTAAFQKRTHPDSLKAMIMAEIRAFESIYIYSRLLTVNKSVPVINYDSDKELFTIQYKGLRTFRIKVALDKARAFKENVLARKLEVDYLSGYRESDTYTVSKISFKDQAGKKTSYDNVDASSGSTIQTDTERKIYEELKRVFPVSGKLP